jgi:CheY-like chemotaxis protein
LADKNSLTESSIKGSSTKPKTILIVDDDEITLNIINQRIIHAGFLTVTANTGLDAIQISQRQHVDLIVMDIRMPALDGYTAAAAIKSDEKSANIPIIGISVLFSTEDLKTAKDAGFDEYMVKPIDTDELLKIIAKY